MYMKACIASQKIDGGDTVSLKGNVADVFANYFCTGDDIKTAIIKTRSKTYFPKLVDHSISIGYGRYIPYEKKKLIDDAVAIYMITDEDGIIHKSKIPDLKGFHGQYEASLQIPE
jgi:hypothetical protein